VPDERLRLDQRAAGAGDPASVERLIAALRRAGRPVPEELLDARRLPSTTAP
jgi:hypothetical protein